MWLGYRRLKPLGHSIEGWQEEFFLFSKMIFAILFKTEENFLKLRSKCCRASKTGNPWLVGWGEYLLPARCGTGLSSGSKAHSKLGTSSGEPNSVIFETRLTRRSGPENPFWNLFRIQNFELGSGSNHQGSFNFYFELNYEIPLISVVFLSVLASLCSLSSSLSLSNPTKLFFLSSFLFLLSSWKWPPCWMNRMAWWKFMPNAAKLQ